MRYFEKTYILEPTYQIIEGIKNLENKDYKDNITKKKHPVKTIHL